MWGLGEVSNLAKKLGIKEILMSDETMKKREIKRTEAKWLIEKYIETANRLSSLFNVKTKDWKKRWKKIAGKKA
jgi:hypothetical protein